MNQEESRARGSSDDRIIEATLRLIARDGLGSVTMRGVAAAAGVSRQTLYNYYPDVDSIAAEAVRRHNLESIRMLEAALRVVERPGDKLEQLVRHVVSIGAHAHHTPGIEGGLSASARAALSEYDRAIDEQIRSILEDGKRTGDFRQDLDPAVDALLIRHLLAGLEQRATAIPDDAAALATTGTRTVLAAVGRRPATPGDD
jgi:AcrR family transcriptional regulator